MPARRRLGVRRAGDRLLGDHFQVDKALADDSYVERKRETLAKYHRQGFAISNHLVGQAVCDLARPIMNLGTWSDPT